MTQRVAVLGLGYVGCVTAACLAELGHSVIGVDPDLYKVWSVQAGKAPFLEPSLDEVVSRNVEAGRLRATEKMGEGLDEADIALVCVGTPSDTNGDLSVEQLRRVSREISTCWNGRTKRLIVAIRSTIYPGTCENVIRAELGSANVVIVANPEFLREGCAVKDFLQPSMIVVGGEDSDARDLVAGLYDGLGVAPSLVELRTAEMIKYACNAFHATKIDFANEIGALCDKMGVAGGEVMRTLCRDTQLNLSAAYLKPGFAFGGSCLPKDLRTIEYRSTQMGLDLPLLKSLLASNERQMDRCVQAVLGLPEGNIGVLGLAFKENTDDLRESPAAILLQRVVASGRKVRVFDPQIRLDSIYGRNLHYLLSTIPGIDKVMAGSLEEMLEWASHVVITKKLDPELRARLEASNKPLLDLASGD